MYTLYYFVSKTWIFCKLFAQKRWKRLNLFYTKDDQIWLIKEKMYAATNLNDWFVVQCVTPFSIYFEFSPRYIDTTTTQIVCNLRMDLVLIFIKYNAVWLILRANFFLFHLRNVSVLSFLSDSINDTGSARECVRVSWFDEESRKEFGSICVFFGSVRNFLR